MMLEPEVATPWTSPSVSASHRRAPFAAAYNATWPPLPPPPATSCRPAVRRAETGQVGRAANRLRPPATHSAARCGRRKPFTRLKSPPAKMRLPPGDSVSARTVEFAFGCQGASTAELVVPIAARRTRRAPFTAVKLPPRYTRLALTAIAYTVPFVFACHFRRADLDVVTAATWAREKPLIVVNPPPM